MSSAFCLTLFSFASLPSLRFDNINNNFVLIYFIFVFLYKYNIYKFEILKLNIEHQPAANRANQHDPSAKRNPPILPSIPVLIMAITLIGPTTSHNQNTSLPPSKRQTRVDNGRSSGNGSAGRLGG